MVQKKALAIILANSYTSYEAALLSLSLERLDSRRNKLCYSFAAKSHKHKSMFPLHPNSRPNMRRPKPYMEHSCNISRYFNSAIPYLARLLNKKDGSTS